MKRPAPEGSSTSPPQRVSTPRMAVAVAPSRRESCIAPPYRRPGPFAIANGRERSPASLPGVRSVQKRGGWDHPCCRVRGTTGASRRLRAPPSLLVPSPIALHPGRTSLARGDGLCGGRAGAAGDRGRHAGACESGSGYLAGEDSSANSRDRRRGTARAGGVHTGGCEGEADADRGSPRSLPRGAGSCLRAEYPARDRHARAGRGGSAPARPRRAGDTSPGDQGHRHVHQDHPQGAGERPGGRLPGTARGPAQALARGVAAALRPAAPQGAGAPAGRGPAPGQGDRRVAGTDLEHPGRPGQVRRFRAGGTECAFERTD